MPTFVHGGWCWRKVTIADLARLWHGDPVRMDITTRPWSVAGSALNWPPVQQPRVPLLIAGAGEQVTLKRVAQHADMCNLLEIRCPTPETVAHKFGVLRAHCDALGRDYGSIVRSHTINALVMAPDAARLQTKLDALPAWVRPRLPQLAKTPEQLAEYYRAMAAAGVQYFTIYLARWDDETLELLANRVVPQLKA
jgi:alkanesulfonate monooxygenase SsuD/methylene tetrahydromethanopterin reductase-like flavin-dependent oxidoreductase (luciferase family)